MHPKGGLVLSYLIPRVVPFETAKLNLTPVFRRPDSLRSLGTPKSRLCGGKTVEEPDR